MLAIRPALFLAVSALALQGCAGINELAGTTGMAGFMGGADRGGEFTPDPGYGQPQMGSQAGVLQQSEQVVSMNEGTDTPTTYIQASDPIDAPPPPMATEMATPATSSMVPQPPPAATQPIEASGRPMMLVPAPGQTMVPVQSSSAAQPSTAPQMSSQATSRGPASVVPLTAALQPVQSPQSVQTLMQPSPRPVIAPATVPAPVQASQIQTAQNQQATLPQMRETAMPQPSSRGREFIPASISTDTMMSSPSRSGEIPLTPGQRNVLERFTILDRLAEEGLITRSERDARRVENIGAILPYSQKAPAVGLERDVPDGDAISSRLDALKRSLEMRAITPRQHAVERSMILDALLSGQPRVRAMPKAPPRDIIEAAAMIGHMERLRADGVISDSEFEAERNAIDAYFVTGSFSASAEPMNSGGTTTSSSSQPAQPVMMTPSANLGLHLASYRSQKAAQDGWSQISKKHAAQLGNLNSSIRRVDLGAGKGTFYRLLAGPVQTRDQAASLCQQLKRSSQYCDPLSLGG